MAGLVEHTNVPACEEGAAAHHLARLRQIASIVNSGGDLNMVLERVVMAACGEPPWVRSGIMAVDRVTGYSELVTRYDPLSVPGVESHPSRWNLATSPSLRVVETRQPVIIEDALTSQEFADYRADAKARGYRTVVVLPLGGSDESGREMVLAVHATQCLQVPPEEIDFLMTAAHLAGIAIGKAKFFEAERRLSERLHKTLSINASLMELVLSGASLAEVAKMIGTIMGEPLIVLDLLNDEAHGTRSPAPATISDEIWSTALRESAGQKLARLLDKGPPGAFRHPMSIDFADCGLPIELTALAEPLQVNGETVGGFFVFPRNGALDDLDRLLAKEAKFALSAQMMRRHAELQRETNDLAELFEHLTEGGWHNRKQILQRASRLGIDLSQPIRLAAVENRRDSRSTGAARSLRRLLPKAFVVEREDAVFIGVPSQLCSEGDTNGNRRAGTLSRRVEDAVNWAFHGKPRIAVGPLCSRLEDFCAARDECLRILTLARMFLREGTLHQEDFGPFALLLSAVDSVALHDFVDETIGAVEAYDREHTADLLDTARVFLDETCRFQATAERLGIHVSTLRYRLTRLKELFSLDLDDTETRFRLSLALRLRMLRGGSDTAG